MKKREVDVLVVGSGSAARAAAFPLRAAGKTVSMVDSRPFGGTCALRGCDAKKVLVGAAEAVDRIAKMRGKGVAGQSTIAWPELMTFKRTFTAPFPAKTIEQLEAAGIVAIHGKAEFVSPNTIRVGSDVFEFKNCVIATGAKPATLGIAGEEFLTNSDGFLDLPALPARVLFIGGGYIAFEFAHVAARTGASVTIAHRGARPLENFDPDLVDRLVARTRSLGIDVRLGVEVTAVRQEGGRFAVSLGNSGAHEEIVTDLVVHAAGRVPNLDDLHLNTANIAREHGVVVDEYMRSTTNSLVYAAGDAAASGGPPLTPVASYEGSVVAHNLLNEQKRKRETIVAPTVVFTIPPLASIGLSEEAARRQGRQIEVKLIDTSGWYSTKRLGETHSGAKVLIDPRTDAILGAHLLGPSADETINLFALAIRSGVPAKSLKEMLFVYPSHASDIHYLL